MEVWGTLRKADNNLERQISSLRAALGDDAKNPRFIERIRGYGYKLLMPVQPEGEPSGRVDAWSNEEYFRFLRKTERLEADKEEDLRIVTTGFSWGVTDSELEPLLTRKVRINIVLMDPTSPLVLARNKLRLATLSWKRPLRALATKSENWPRYGSAIRRWGSGCPPQCLVGSSHTAEMGRVWGCFWRRIPTPRGRWSVFPRIRRCGAPFMRTGNDVGTTPARCDRQCGWVMISREGFIDQTVRAKHPNKHRRDWKHELPARLVDTWRTSSAPRRGASR